MPPVTIHVSDAWREAHYHRYKKRTEGTENIIRVGFVAAREITAR